MKTPCEITVWYVLPVIRRELAKELVDGYGMKQSQVAKIFGITDAAVSQYLKNKRGASPIIEENPNYRSFLQEVSVSARNLSEGRSDMTQELCRICSFMRTTGYLAGIYTQMTGEEAPSCTWSAQSHIRPM